MNHLELARRLEMENNWSAAAAAYLRLLQMDSKNFEVVLRLAECYERMGDCKASAIVYAKAIELNPGDARLFLAQGIQLARSQQFAGSFASLKKAIELDPYLEEAYVYLSDLERLAQRYDLSEETARKGLEKFPRSFRLQGVLARGLADQDRQAEADSHFRQSASLNLDALLGYAQWLQEVGRFEESAQQLQEALVREPNQGLAYWQLSQMKVFALNGDSFGSSALAIYKLDELQLEQKMFLAYALGALFEHEGRIDQSIHFYDRANALAFQLYNRGRPYDPEEERSRITRLERKISSGLSTSNSGWEAPIPIFVVGMIRSGTSLLTQILSNHQEVASVGESSFWLEAGGKVALTPDFGSEQLHAVAEAYLKQVSPRIKGARWFVDKMPLNFQVLGLIKAAMPEAKIVHIMRDSSDTCASIYSNHFGPSTHWMYDKRRIGRFYREYERTIDFWRTKLPAESLIEICYEELVKDPVTITRKLCEDLGLPWTESLLDFRSNTGPVSTPSRWQARQPIFQSSIGRGKLFEPYFGEFGL